MRTPVRVASRSKYRAIRTNGYASKKEAKRGAELEMLEKAGEIRTLRKQHSFILLKADELGRQIRYVADFSYWDEGKREFVVEDVKGFRTQVYKLKRRLMYSVHGLIVQEV